jgi:LmbE family N-acetylglucosaminyl deacetylase
VTVLCLEPHADDCALFAAFSAMQHGAHVITVLSSRVQFDRGYGITQQQRHAENQAAMRELGVTHEQWHYPDSSPDWDAVEAAMRVADDLHGPELVLAPAVEPDGHDQHSAVGSVSGRVFGDRCRFYLTYRRGHGRSVGRPVSPTPEQIARKLRALACFRSQIAEPSTRPWFLDGVGEWLA